MAETNNQQGLPALAQALAALGQINAILPVAIAAGTAVAAIVRSFRGTSREADEAIAAFEANAKAISDTASKWLEDHPVSEVD
jgi:predicted membrane-bound mannosyltransferase